MKPDIEKVLKEIGNDRHDLFFSCFPHFFVTSIQHTINLYFSPIFNHNHNKR